jgi:hypothetical protein
MKMKIPNNFIDKHYIGKRIFTINIFLVYINIAYGQNISNEIDILGQECAKGEYKSCKKLAKIAKNSANLNERMEAVDKINDKSVLTDIARNPKYYNNVESNTAWKIRIAAAQKINDTSFINDCAKRLAKTSVVDLKVHQKLIEIITDQSILRYIAKKGYWPEVRDAAIKKLTDQIKKLTDQNLLKKIAENDEYFELRFAAIEMITDQSFLYDIAIKSYRYNRMMSEVAINTITNQSVLADIVKNSTIKEQKEYAFKKITDQSVLIDIAKINKDMRHAALKNITDQSFLIDIFENDKDMRYEVLENITDQSFLNEIANNGKVDNYVREAAVKKINEQSVLIKIAKNDKEDYRVREAALENITDQNVLIEIAKNGKADNSVREAAVKKINDQSVLIKIAKNDKEDDRVREAAINKITDQSALKDIVNSNNRYYIIRAGINNLIDQNILSDIVKNDKDTYRCKTAFKRITDKSIIQDVFMNSKNIDFLLKYCYNDFDVTHHYKELMNIINSYKDNRYSLAGLKLIPLDTILKRYYPDLKIFVKCIDEEDQYYMKNIIGLWITIDFLIEVNLNGSPKQYFYKGQRGTELENIYSIGKHEGIININEICEDILSPLSKNDLINISQKSDIKYLRESAARMLNSNKNYKIE